MKQIEKIGDRECARALSSTIGTKTIYILGGVYICLWWERGTSDTDTFPNPHHFTVTVTDIYRMFWELGLERDYG